MKNGVPCWKIQIHLYICSLRFDFLLVQYCNNLDVWVGLLRSSEELGWNTEIDEAVLTTEMHWKHKPSQTATPPSLAFITLFFAASVCTSNTERISSHFLN